jgi:hypothetical protein
VKERPILFSASMARAILAGRKTQTRRAVKLREFGPSDSKGYDWTFRDRRALWNDVSTERLMELCPYGQAGERLWVRETWAAAACSDGLSPKCLSPNFLREIGGAWYQADVEGLPVRTWERGRWRPSIHMPRWASRITLEVTSVSVERLQSLSMADVAAEGFAACEQFEGSLAQTWDAINGPGSWASNPWVWAISFRVLP